MSQPGWKGWVSEWEGGSRFRIENIHNHRDYGIEGRLSQDGGIEEPYRGTQQPETWYDMSFAHQMFRNVLIGFFHLLSRCRSSDVKSQRVVSIFCVWTCKYIAIFMKQRANFLSKENITQFTSGKNYKLKSSTRCIQVWSIGIPTKKKCALFECQCI